MDLRQICPSLLLHDNRGIIHNKQMNGTGEQTLNYNARVMVFNLTFNNIPVISLRSSLLVEETGVPGENHRPVASH